MDPANSSQPPVPSPPPRLPRRELWWCLLAPSLATLLAVLITISSGISGYAYTLWMLPLVVGPLTGFICTPWFIKMLRRSYSGRRLTLMSIAYPLGQLIITPAVGLGGCMLGASLL